MHTGLSVAFSRPVGSTYLWYLHVLFYYAFFIGLAFSHNLTKRHKIILDLRESQKCEFKKKKLCTHGSSRERKAKRVQENAFPSN